VTDAELRAIVRAAVARHLGGEAGSLAPARPTPPPRPVSPPDHRSGPWQQHASHQLYVSLVNVDSACVIEPAVTCDHCGYCKSHGH
jgi:hypothetical protein